MADVQILAPGVESAPLPFTVPPAVEILLKSARASFDGSGAGSAWLPAVRLTSPAGVVQTVARTDSTVAAGASADVSFFPGAKPQAASGATVTPPAFAALTFTNAQTVNAGTSKYLGFDSFFTDNLNVFGTSSGGGPPLPITDTTGDTYLVLRVPGAYHLQMSGRFSGGGYPRQLFLEAQWNAPGQDIVPLNDPSPDNYTSDNLTPDGSAVMNADHKAVMAQVTSQNDAYRVKAFNGDAINHTVSQGTLLVFYQPFSAIVLQPY